MINDDLRMVVELALLTEDRTRAEQAALRRVAARVDRVHNRQTTTNPKLRGWPISLRDLPPCTYPTLDEHGKACVCRGDGRAIEPEGGWSLLARQVEW